MRCNQTADVRVIPGYGEIAFNLPADACACAANTKSTSENHNALKDRQVTCWPIKLETLRGRFKVSP